MPQMDIDLANRLQRIQDINHMNATFSRVLGSPSAFIPRRQVCKRVLPAMSTGSESVESPSPTRTEAVRFPESRPRLQDVSSREAAVHYGSTVLAVLREYKTIKLSIHWAGCVVSSRNHHALSEKVLTVFCVHRAGRGGEI